MNGQREYFTMPDPTDTTVEAQCFVDVRMEKNRRVIGDYGVLIMEGTKIVMSLKPAWLTMEILQKVAKKMEFNDLEKNNTNTQLNHGRK